MSPNQVRVEAELAIESLRRLARKLPFGVPTMALLRLLPGLGDAMPCDDGMLTSDGGETGGWGDRETTSGESRARLRLPLRPGVDAPAREPSSDAELSAAADEAS